MFTCITVLLWTIGVDDFGTGANAAAQTAPAAATGAARLDEWGNRFTSLGASILENAQRPQIRTTIAQLAMFEAINAVLDRQYRPLASKPPSPAGASAEAAAIRAAYIVALHEFPTLTATIETSGWRTRLRGCGADIHRSHRHALAFDLDLTSGSRTP